MSVIVHTPMPQIRCQSAVLRAFSISHTDNYRYWNHYRAVPIGDIWRVEVMQSGIWRHCGVVNTISDAARKIADRESYWA